MQSMQKNSITTFSFIKSKASTLLKNRYISILRGVPLPNVTGEKAQKMIASAIQSGRRLVARVGLVEGRTLAHYLRNRKSETSPLSYPEKIREQIKFNAGFFPNTDHNIDELCELYIDSIREIDIYAAWTPYDRLFIPHDSILCKLWDLDPFFTTEKWTFALKDRRITVVSPFKKTILEQYKRYDLLFRSKTIPRMVLSVVRAPMTQCLQNVDDQNWFENLLKMQEKIKQQNPEVVIIGAGAYGLPLGAYAKLLGCSAVVLGGATQLLFGIIGNRWENDQPISTDLLMNIGAVHRRMKDQRDIKTSKSMGALIGSQTILRRR